MSHDELYAMKFGRSSQVEGWSLLFRRFALCNALVMNLHCSCSHQMSV